MHELWKKGAAIGFLVFLGLWVTGLIRASSQPVAPPPAWPLSAVEELASRRQQVANNLKQIGLAGKPLPASSLEQPDVQQIQVFERTAQLATATAAFGEDEALVRAAIADHRATVFNEKMSGIAPQRRLTLEIGVHPDRFDGLVEQLREVGRLESVSVQQRDRTGEFRRLHAQRQTLKKHLEAVVKLRGKKLSVDDELKVEQKIQDVEKEIQALSVQLGDLLGKESFYHIDLTLFEAEPGSRLDRTWTLPRRLAHAFLWALPWWFAFAVVAGAVPAAFVSLYALWPGRR